MPRILRAIFAAHVCLAAALAAAAPLTSAEIAALCGNAEDSSHCGRLIEEAQLKRLPALARRDGNTLVVSLYPSGSVSFVDSDDPVNGRSYSLWNYLDGINAVVLYATAGDATTFTLLQRTTNRRVELPAEPVLSPDRQRIVTADVCASGCSNEIAVWQVAREGVRKELTWTAPPGWSDAAATWKDAGTLALEYGADGATGKSLERKLNEPGWKRVAP